MVADIVITTLWVFGGVLAFAGIFFILFGLLLVLLCIRKGRGDIDESNVWNRLIGVVYTAMHPEVFGGIEFWKNDICENIKLVKIAVESIESCGSNKADSGITDKCLEEKDD